MFNRMIYWSLKNRLLVVVGLVVFLAAATYATMRMPVDVFPEFAPPQVVVQTESPGLAPEDVEALITFPVESAVNGTPGVDKVRSQSSVGLSTVVIVFQSPFRSRTRRTKRWRYPCPGTISPLRWT